MDPYKVHSWGLPVGLGVTGAQHLHLSAVGKTDYSDVPFCVFNELVAGELGRRIRLPIPPFCVVEDVNDEAFFASLDFNLTGLSLPPVWPHDFAIAFPDAVGSLLVFDAFICNSDRHCGNLSADYTSDRYNVFDHSHAVLGGNHHGLSGLPRLIAATSTIAIDGSMGNRHCLIDELTHSSQLLPMVERIETIEDYFITDVVQSAAEYGVDDDVRDHLITFLLARRDNLRTLLNTHSARFSSVMIWSDL